MTKDMNKLTEEIFEANDCLPHTLTTRTRIWKGLVKILDGQPDHYRTVIGFSHDDLVRRASSTGGRLVDYDYYDGGIQAVLEDSVDELWEFAHTKAERKMAREVIE